MSAFKLTDRQKQGNKKLAGKATHTMLFGGGRSGKTFLLCRAIATRAIKAPKSRHAILRFRFNHVKNSVVLDTWPKMMELCYPNVNYTINKTDWYAQFDNGAEVWFGGLDEKERSEKILGMEFVTIYLNECSQIPQASRDIMITRLAQQVNQTVGGVTKPLNPKFFYDCNPPSKAHWTYRLFIKKQDLETKKTLDNPDDYESFQMNPIHNVENLASTYLQSLKSMGARERLRFLAGEFSDATENALFNDATFEKWRVLDETKLPQLVRVVIAVDPSGSGDTDNAHNDAIGITAAGLGADGNGYLLADLAVKAGPATWGRIVTDAYDRYQANVVVGEINFGGAMVGHVVQTARPRTPFKTVTASRGKSVRAEPVAALYEQGRIKHVGYYPELEDEYTQFTTNGYIGENSPNRADAAVWAFTELFGGIVKEKEKPTQFTQPWQPTDAGMGLMG